MHGQYLILVPALLLFVFFVGVFAFGALLGLVGLALDAARRLVPKRAVRVEEAPAMPAAAIARVEEVVEEGAAAYAAA